jgi:K+-sensing histidine kinase KdpD
MMPQMNGYEVLDNIRKNPHTFGTPFLFLTAKADKSDLRQGMELGADDYLTKPFENEEILAAIKTRFEKHEKMKAHYEQTLDELRQNVTTSIPHELRTPLNSILGFTQILKSSYSDLSKSDIDMMFDNILDSGKRLMRLIINYSYYTNLINLEDVNKSKDDIVENITGMIKDQAMQIADKYSKLENLEFRLPDEAINIPENQLLKLTEELVDNACKFSLPGTPIRISGDVNSEQYSLSVSNFGRGMSKEQINSIGAFMQFERRTYEQQGMGLGLAIVKKIADINEGDFSIESDENDRTSVRVKLPLAKK